MQKEKKGFKGIRDLKITWKMLISSLVPVVILLIVWLLMVQCLNATKIGSKLYDEIMLSNTLTADILPPPEYVIEPYLTALEFISAPDAAKRNDLLTYFNQLEETYKQRFDYWKDALVNQDEIKQVFLGDAYNSAMSFFTTFHQEVEPAVKSNDTAAMKSAAEHLDQAYKTHRAAIDKTVALSSDWVAAVTKNAESTSRFSNTEILAIIIAAIFFSLLCSFVISRSMVKHIKYVSAINRRIADGELSASIDDKCISSDEIGQLCLATSRILKRLNSYVGYIREITDALETMAGGNMHISLKRAYEGEFVSIKEALLRISKELGSTISAIRDSADRVNNGAEQIAGGAQTLAQASTAQSSSLEGIVGSITKVSGDATRNSDNIRIVTELVASSGRGVLESDEHMRRLIVAMSDINTAANRISGIIKTIDDISFQTNILALNASIEAARAGVAGKGFSIVADEVRLLANKSAEAASQTSDLIMDAIYAINQGKTATELTAGALQDVKAKTAEVEKTIREISAASTSQAIEIQAVTESLAQISGIVQQNSATAEESAAVSQQLSAQSESLRYIVGRFVLENDDEIGTGTHCLPEDARVKF